MKFIKKTLNDVSLKVKRNQGDIVKNDSARAKKYRGGGVKRPHPPPSLFKAKSWKKTICS